MTLQDTGCSTSATSPYICHLVMSVNRNQDETGCKRLQEILELLQPVIFCVTMIYMTGCRSVGRFCKSLGIPAFLRFLEHIGNAYMDERLVEIADQLVSQLDVHHQIVADVEFGTST